MIVSSVLNLFVGMLELVFGWIQLPNLPDSIMSIIDTVFGYITGSIGLLGVFVDLDVVMVLIPLAIVVARFDDLWKMTMFVLRKIPFVNIG